MADATSYQSYFFAYMGVVSGLVFANLGASYGTAKSGVGIASLGVIDSSKVVKALIPIIMAGILGIYGLIVAVLLNLQISKSSNGPLKVQAGYQYLGAGLCCGLSSLASPSSPVSHLRLDRSLQFTSTTLWSMDTSLSKIF